MHSAGPGSRERGYGKRDEGTWRREAGCRVGEQEGEETSGDKQGEGSRLAPSAQVGAKLAQAGFKLAQVGRKFVQVGAKLAPS